VEGTLLQVQTLHHCSHFIGLKYIFKNSHVFTGMEENRIRKRVLYMNMGTTRLRARPRKRWQDEVREDG
jgi:hypothetical protein